MRDTVIEVEEVEKERVFCDDCGDDCTDSELYEVREVCPGCSSTNSAYRKLRRAQEKINDCDQVNGFWGALSFGILLFPVGFILTLMDIFGYYSRGDEEWHGALATTIYTVGVVLWTLATVGLLLV